MSAKWERKQTSWLKQPGDQLSGSMCEVSCLQCAKDPIQAAHGSSFPLLSSTQQQLALDPLAHDMS